MSGVHRLEAGGPVTLWTQTGGAFACTDETVRVPDLRAAQWLDELERERAAFDVAWVFGDRPAWRVARRAIEIDRERARAAIAAARERAAALRAARAARIDELASAVIASLTEAV